MNDVSDKTKQLIDFIKEALAASDELSEETKKTLIPLRKKANKVYVKLILEAVYELSYKLDYSCYFPMSSETVEKYNMSSHLIKINSRSCPTFVQDEFDEETVIAHLSLNGRQVAVEFNCEYLFNGWVEVDEETRLSLFYLVETNAVRLEMQALKERKTSDGDVAASAENDNVVSVDFSRGRTKH